jgi:RNA polymerase sigma-70 factor (ECF subfamily)
MKAIVDTAQALAPHFTGGERLEAPGFAGLPGDETAAPAHEAALSPDVRLRAAVDAHFDTVWRSLQNLGVPSEGIDDASQQVFIILARKLATVDAGGERAYLLGIAVRVAADARRSRRRRREIGLEDTFDTPTELPSADELVDQKRARELLTLVLNEMPEEQREAFVLFEVEGLGVAEIASALAIPIGTVGSRIRRARDFFQKKVQRLVRASNAGGQTR